jgi:voltage-gated potassium channel
MSDDVVSLRAVLTVAAARTVAVAAFAIALYATLPVSEANWWIAAVLGVTAIGAVVPLTVRRVHDVGVAERPMLAAAEAVFLLLVMVVFGFSAVYLTLAQRPGQFDGIETHIDAVYFTVTTLSTVGFGDINPTGQAARVVVTIQVLFDLTLVAVSVRVLVAAARRRRAAP